MHKDDGAETILPAEYTPPTRRRRRRAARDNAHVGGPGVWAWTFLFVLIGFPLSAVLLTRPVEVRTTPEAAQISIDGLVVPFDGRFIALKGPHRVSVSAPGYVTWAQDIRIGRPENDRIEAVLTPLPGALDVRVPDVDAAEVRLAGGEWEKAPANFADLEPGTYALEARAPRHRPATVEALVPGLDQTVEVEIALQPAWGRFEISLAAPPSDGGAELWVDGALRATGLSRDITTLDLLEGTHQIEIRAPKFAAWQERVEIAAGDALTLGPVTLLPARATLLIETRPDRANLLLDDVFIGQAPMAFGMGPGESHRLQASLDGYQSRVTEFAVKPGETKRLVVELEPEFALLKIVSLPAEASLQIDDESLGAISALPKEGVRVAADRHTLTATADGFAPMKVEVELLPGDVREVSMVLVTEEAAKEAARVAAETARAERLASLPDTVSGPLDMGFQLIRPHPVTLGSSRREPGRRANERLHDVTLRRPFYIGTHEVTNAQMRMFDANHDSGFIAGLSLNAPQQPAVNLSWAKAAAFANWMSELAGLTPVYILDAETVTGFHPEADGYRLPTEAEWAFVARAGGEGPWLNFPWGMDMPPPLRSGNYADLAAVELTTRVLPGYRDGYAVSAPVGAFAANRFGLYDLGGNVAEWVHDVYALDPAQGQVLEDPMGAQSGTLHSQRGSSWAHARETELRFAYRGYGSQPRNDLGFRLARRIQ